MEKYKLKEDEVVLFKGDVVFANREDKTKLMLTNYNIVFTSINKVDDEESFINDVFAVDSVKMYEGKPQIKTKGKNVEIYLKETELEFAFVSQIDESKFVEASTKLLTGKTKLERGAEKIKEVIALTDKTFGIDSVHEVGEMVKSGGIAKLTKGIGNVVKKIKK